jgi:hypothetical protein
MLGGSHWRLVIPLTVHERSAVKTPHSVSTTQRTEPTHTKLIRAGAHGCGRRNFPSTRGGGNGPRYDPAAFIEDSRETSLTFTARLNMSEFHWNSRYLKGSGGVKRHLETRRWKRGFERARQRAVGDSCSICYRGSP